MKFEGEINDVSEKQLEFIRSVLEKHGFRNELVSVEAVGKLGDNFMACVKRIIVKNEGETFKMIAKVAPKSETVRIPMNTVSVFSNEHLMYTEVLPKFSELEEAAGVPDNARLRYAVCYGSLLEAPNEIILLEDLKESNFIILDKLKSLSDDTVRLVLKNFAFLHSLSYALKNQEPQTFETIKNKLIDIWGIMGKSEDTKMYFHQLEADIVQVIDNEMHKEVFKGSVAEVTDSAIKALNNNRESKCAVIQQGDPWTNNIMFQMKNAKPVSCCMIDYQISKVSSPVFDILYLILNCTDYETRSLHYHDWINYYHKELEISLAYYGLKTDDYCPRNQLEDDLKAHAKLSLGISAVLASTLFREASDVILNVSSDFEATSMKEMVDASRLKHVDPKTLERFRIKLGGCIDSFIDLGYF